MAFGRPGAVQWGVGRSDPVGGEQLLEAQMNLQSLRGVRRGLVAVAAVAMSMGMLTGTAGAAAPDQADGVEPFDRDVYVVVGSTLRNPDETTDPSAPLFNVAGVGLGHTWGQWVAADATSVVKASGSKKAKTDVRLTFTGLVPNGVYSVFYGTLLPDSENPLCPGVERTLAVPSTDPAQAPDASSFVASSTGAGSFHGQVAGNLLESAQQVFFSIVYHLDGKTYGPLPNAGEHTTYQSGTCRSSFGEDAMRQMLILQKW